MPCRLDWRPRNSSSSSTPSWDPCRLPWTHLPTTMSCSSFSARPTPLPPVADSADCSGVRNEGAREGGRPRVQPKEGAQKPENWGKYCVKRVEKGNILSKICKLGAE